LVGRMGVKYRAIASVMEALRLRSAGAVGIRGMSPNIGQHFTDQHPSLLAAIPVYFVTLWLGIGAIISSMGGWLWLSKLYRAQVEFGGAKWGRQSGRMRWLTNYNNVLTLGASRDGLYLAMNFLFRFMHPPLLIPWAEIKVRKSKGWFFEYVTFTMGRETEIPLRIRAKLADQLKNEASNNWPVEEM
jgi:hypothetical protein